MTILDARTFNAKLFTCIDRALSSLGSGVNKALYFQAYQKYGISEEQIASRALEFMKVLEDMLGTSGFAIVEKVDSDRNQSFIRHSS